ncbi:head decoration protein [Methylotuvimicrobium sp. KM1]|uniref:head decoration protein n=1 Tax=Methylotuvimicrobium sp. KM1 TaxID=3377707 RepID=UPI00384EAFA2
MIFTEPNRAGEFLLTEVSPQFRENVTVAEGQDLPAGAVVAKLTAGGKFVALDPEADSTGAEVAAGVLYSAVNATESDKPGLIISRLAVVNGAALTWPEGISGGDKADAVAALELKFLIVR